MICLLSPLRYHPTHKHKQPHILRPLVRVGHDYQTPLPRQFRGNAFHHRLRAAGDGVGFIRRLGDMHVVFLGAVFFPAVGDFDGAGAAVGFGVVGGEAAVLQDERVALGAGKTNFGGAGTGGDVVDDGVVAHADVGAGEVVDGGVGFAVVVGDLQVPGIAGVAGAVEGADAEARQVAGRGDGEGDGAGAAGEDSEFVADVFELGVEVGVEELLPGVFGFERAFEVDGAGVVGTEGDGVHPGGERGERALRVLDGAGDLQRVEAGVVAGKDEF